MCMCVQEEEENAHDIAERREEKVYDRQLDGCLAPVPSSYFLIAALVCIYPDTYIHARTHTPASLLNRTSNNLNYPIIFIHTDMIVE